MAQLIVNAPRITEIGAYGDQPVAAAVVIYEGSAIGFTAGYARQLVALDIFGGFATAKADNTAGAAGALNVNVNKSGEIILTVGTAAITDIGASVYASDGNAFTLTSAGNTLIGKISRWISTGVVVVKFNAHA